MLQNAAKVFGVVFLLIGFLGFVPGITNDDNHLLGIFEVGGAHNVIHLASGVAALWAGYTSAVYSRLYFQIFGVVYALVTVLGFVYGDDKLLGFMEHNMADTFLHLVITGAALYFGFVHKDRDDTTTAT